jgi:predicted NUDIX family NTP pyrophosphohydrolase
MAPARQPQSAGILLYRLGDDGVRVLIAHPGGPFWSKRDEGAWSIPNGLIDEGETPAAAARREFEEETGHAVTADLVPLGVVEQRSHKAVHGFAAMGQLDPEAIVSNTFSLEWPPRSGSIIAVPEIDRVAWCTPDEAKRLLNVAQADFVDRLLEYLGEGPGGRG